MSAAPPTRDDIEQAVQCVREHAEAARLGAFAYEILSTQADGHLILAGPRFAQDAASAHELDRERAATEAGNLLAIVEHGPASGLEVALVGAFATAGFGAHCLAAGSGKRRELARTLVEHMGWLEVATCYRITPFVGILLPAEVRGLVEDALLDAVLKEDSSSADVDSAQRARNAARLTSLARSHADAVQSAFSRVRETARDPATRAVASALLGHATAAGGGLVLRARGVAHAPQRRASVAILRWLSGVALLSALYRLVCFLIRWKHEAELELEGGLLRVRNRTSFLGRVVRSSEAAYTLDRISGAFRRARFALLRSAVGVLSLSLGILLGGHLLFDGARGGAPLLLIVGAAIVFVGSTLDLALEILVPARAGQVELQVDLLGARSVRLSRVPLADADRLLASLADRVSLHATEALRTPLPALRTADATPTSGLS